ncbi:hypothetical protein TNCV_1786291 [Trichonephila clavipes]|nr:hypothetical protein TNCV_1786291 [Trichonephila clavipes]
MKRLVRRTPPSATPNQLRQSVRGSMGLPYIEAIANCVIEYGNQTSKLKRRHRLLALLVFVKKRHFSIKSCLDTVICSTSELNSGIKL